VAADPQRKTIERMGWPRWRRIWPQALRALTDLTFPPRCANCDAEVPAPAPANLPCAACLERLLATAAERCSGCGAPLANGMDRCAECRLRPPAFDRVWVLGDYAGELRTAVLRMKRASEEPLAVALAELLFQRAGAEMCAWRPDAVLPTPMHWLRRAIRGANSAETLGAVLARRLAAPSAAGCLVRRRFTRPQSGLSPHARFLNVRGAFRLRPGVDLAQARVLLVDDILTTGATCGEIAKRLKHAGAAVVAVAVIARAAR
jgi:ComF family protein